MGTNGNVGWVDNVNVVQLNQVFNLVRNFLTRKVSLVQLFLPFFQDPANEIMRVIIENRLYPFDFINRIAHNLSIGMLHIFVSDELHAYY